MACGSCVIERRDPGEICGLDERTPMAESVRFEWHLLESIPGARDVSGRLVDLPFYDMNRIHAHSRDVKDGPYRFYTL